MLQLPADKTRHMQDKGVLGPARQQGFVGPLVYIGNTTTAQRLGCDPSACGCFFNFQQARLHLHGLALDQECRFQAQGALQACTLHNVWKAHIFQRVVSPCFPSETMTDPGPCQNDKAIS